MRYARCGCYDQALAAIGELVEGGWKGWMEENKLSPMLYYYAAYYNSLLGRQECAAGMRAAGAGASPEYCFPNRLESLPVLEWAAGQDPQDARALYYLGNLYYARDRDQEAIASWEKSVALEPGNAVAQRNLGYALYRSRQLERARTAYLQAVKADPGLSAAVMELDDVNKKLGNTTEDRLAFLREHFPAVTGHDALLTRFISLLVQSGSYDEALEWLGRHHFHSWEGRYGIHQYWVESHLQKGDGLMAEGSYQEALEHYKLALTYPFNLEVAAMPQTVHARKLYKIGTALEALGRSQEAAENFRTVVAERDTMRLDSAYRFYLGKALEKLGRSEEAREVYQGLLAEIDRQESSGENHLSSMELQFDPDRNPEALNHFKRSLALEGLGRKEEADAERRKAVGQDPIVALRAFSPPRAGW